MITPSFSLTATERVLPKLALDFTTASLDPRVTFTRTTSSSNPATFVNSTGIITTAANNAARFDYDPVSLVCKGLLIEESRSNAFRYSNDFSNGVWTPLQASISTASNTNPEGGATSFTFLDNATTNQHTLNQTFTSAVGTTYTYSVYLKAIPGSNVNTVGINRVTANGFGAISLYYFDLSNGTIAGAAVTGGTATITPAGNGWYRCTLTATSTANTSTAGLGLYLVKNGSFNYLGTGTDGVYVYGAQLEAGAFATSYIPTTTTALTRNADVATMTGTNFSDWYNAAEGTFVADYISANATVNATKGILSADNNSANNRIYCYLGSTGAPTLRVVSGGTLQMLNSNPAVSNNVANSSAWYYKSGTQGLSTNGGSLANGTGASIPTVDRLSIGRFTTTEYFNGYISAVRYFPQKVTASELQANSK